MSARIAPASLVLLALVGCGAGSAPPAPPPAAAEGAARPPATRPGWLAEVREAVAAGEYRIRGQGTTFEAVNRLQGLRARWSRGELGVAARTGHGADRAETIKLRTVGLVGRGGARAAAGPHHLGDCGGLAVKDENGQCLRRLERAGNGLVERWENRPDGLAHSFLVSPPPAGARPGADGWLAIEVAVTGARVELAAGSTSAELIGKGGQRLRYAGLAAWDADEKRLPVRMRRAAGGIRLEVDDRGARYPLLVDPVLTAGAWTSEGNQADAGVTMVVAGAGDVNNDGFDDVLVSFPRYDGGGTDAGVVYLYFGSGTGPDTTADWTSQGTSAAGAAAASADSRFGNSIAGAGDVNNDGFADVIIGQPRFSNGQTFEGRAYLFPGSAAGLPAVPAWTVESDQANAFLGLTVAGLGDINGPAGGASFDDVAVTAGSFDSNGLTDNGRVLVYLGAAGGLAAAPSDTIDGAFSAFGLGTLAASAGDVNGDGRSDVILASPYYSNGEMDEGIAYVHLGRADGTLERTGAFTFETNEAGAPITSVAGVGDVNGDGYADVALGVPGKNNGVSDEGAVLFFAGSASGLVAVPTILGSSDGGSSFGVTVAGPGDVNGDGYADIAVGAYRRDTPGLANVGSVTLIAGSRGGPAITAATLADTILYGIAAEDNLGNALAGAGDVNGDGYADVIAGSTGADNGQANEGRASIYFGSANTSGLRALSDLGIESNTAGAGLGTALSAAGDLNGDGFGDFVVAAPSFGGANNGTVFVHLGAVGGPDGTADGTLTGPAGAGFGEAVAAAGDVNGDGFADLLVGAPNFGDGQVDEGRIYLYPGASGGITAATVPVTFDSNVAGALLGSAVGAADVNGDGLSDVAAGAPGLANGQVGEGRVYVLRGSLAGLTTASPITVESDLALSRFGAALAGVGDVNADGYADLAVGAPGYSNGEIGEGRLYIYPGSAAGLGAPITREVDVAGAALGTSVAGAGDADENGYADVIAGAPGSNSGAGVVYVYEATAAGVTDTPFSYASAVAGASLGAAVAGAGDLDNDGVGDVVVGAPGYANGQAGEGALYVFLSGGTVLPGMPSAIIEGGTADLRLGSAVAGAGDLNGDGVSDVVVGAPGYASGQAGEGRALVHLGNTNGRPYRLRALRPGTSTPVQAGNVVPSSMAAFDIAIFATGPLGITNVRLETEVKPVGVPFDGNGTVLDPGFTSTGLAGVTLTRSVTGLAGRTRYHFRARLHYDPAQRTLLGLTTPWINGGALGDAGGVHLRTDGVGLGTACTMASDCGSGFCVDGVCCDTDCGGGATGDCRACTMAAGGTLASGICSDRAVAATCSDGNGCTAADTCQAGGVCQPGTAVTCTAMSQCHDLGVCNPATGMCTNPTKADGTTCNDNSMCTTGETCQAGACASGTATVCPPMSTCHDPGVCNPGTGTCSTPVKADGSSCSDGNLCTQTDTCTAGVCNGANPVTCAAPNACQDPGTCVAATGLCSYPPKPDGTACSDGNLCTGTDVCTAGSCVGPAVDCNDGNVCTTDTCVLATGCVRTPVVGCVPTDGGADASGDGPRDGAGDGAGDASGDGARDGASGDARPADGATGDARDAARDTTSADRPADTRASDGGASIRRVGGGGGCDCDVGRGQGTLQAPLLLLGLGLIWYRRRRR